MPALRARDIIRGVVPALAIAVPAVVAQVVVRPGPGGELGLYVLLLAGLVLGGWRAGRLGVSAPMSSGALAALVAFALVQIAAVVVGQLNNRPLPPVAPIVFNTGMAICAGLFGGFVASFSPTADPKDSGDR